VENLSYEFNLDAGEFHILLDKKKAVPDLVIPPKKIDVPLNFQGNLQIYPNPSAGNLNIYMNTAAASVLYFYDAVGHFVGSVEIATVGEQTISLALLNLSLQAGVYFCKMVSGETAEIKKFIIL